MRKCQCGTEVEYDGYNTIEIEEGFFRIEGDAICPNCQKEYFYTEIHRCDFNNPFEVELEENHSIKYNIYLRGEMKMDKNVSVSYDVCKLCLKSEIKDNWEWYCRGHKIDLKVIWEDKNFKCKLIKPL